MKPTDWAAQFFEKLSGLMGARIRYGYEPPGCFRARLSHLGLLVICEDDSDCSVWLLDADGRTDGPIWAGSISQITSLIAATESKRAIDATPRGVSFSAWPPVGRDFEMEELVNGAWRTIRERIDAQPASRDTSDVKRATDLVWRFIDQLIQSDGSGSLAEYIEPFKMQAADLIRSKYDPS